MTRSTFCACGGYNHRTVFSGVYRRMAPDPYPFSVVQCTECGLRRTEPPPDSTIYERGIAHTSVREPGGANWSRKIVRELSEQARFKSRVLDVGCNVGDLVAAALDAGFDAEGIDLDPRVIAVGEALGRPVRMGSLAGEQGPFDVVVAVHVVEHVPDLREFFSGLERVLREGGLAFIFVPNCQGLMPRLMRERWIGWLPAEHYWHFTPESFRRTCSLLSSLHIVDLTTKGVIEPPSQGWKAVAKNAAVRYSRVVGVGDQIEAVLMKQ